MSTDHSSNATLQEGVPTQKLVWVTPTISLMTTGQSEGKDITITDEILELTNFGPS